MPESGVIEAIEAERSVHAGRREEGAVVAETDAGRHLRVVCQLNQFLPLLAQEHPETRLFVAHLCVVFGNRYY